MIGRTILPISAAQQITVGTGKYAVTFYDFDGTVLKIHKVNAGENATAPTAPTHEFLTFNSWNNPFTNVQNDIDVGAIYNTTDGKTYMFISVNSITGLAPNLYFSKSSTSLMTINWGDGTTSTSTTSGNQNIQHTYATAGDYIITVDNSAGGTWSLGQGLHNLGIFGNTISADITNSILTKLYMGTSALLVNYSLYYQRNLTYIAINTTTSFSGHRMVQFCFSLQWLNLTTNSSTFGISPIADCRSLKGVTANNGVLITSSSDASNLYNLSLFKVNINTTNIYSYFLNATNIESVVMPYSITTVGADSFSNCNRIREIIFTNPIPPTFSSNLWLRFVPVLLKVYVPDASVAAYKAATNIAGIYDSYIYPLSTKP